MSEIIHESSAQTQPTRRPDSVDRRSGDCRVAGAQAGHLRELYGINASPDLISAVTDAVLDEVTTWQNRPLEPVYPLIFFDALRVKVRDEGLVRNKTVHIALVPAAPRAASLGARSDRETHFGYRRGAVPALPGSVPALHHACLNPRHQRTPNFERNGAVAELVGIGVTAPPASSGYRFRRRGQCIEVQAVWRGSASRPPCAL